MPSQRKLVTILLILPLFAFVSADWFRQTLDDNKISINFPLKPERMVQANGSVIWRYMNDVSVCMVSMVDLHTMGMDSLALKGMLDKPESLQEFRDGLTGQFKGAKLLEEAKAELSGFPTYDVTVDISASAAEADKDIMYTKTVFVGMKLYSLYYHEKKGKLQEQERKQFFGSFKAIK